MRHQSVNENKLIPLRRLAEISSYSPAYLSLLAQRKKLKTKRVGRNFFTTKKWFNDYLESHAQEEKRLSSREAASAPPPGKLISSARPYGVSEFLLLSAPAGVADREEKLAEVFNKKIMAAALTTCLAVVVLFVAGLWQIKLMNGGVDAEPAGRVAGITETGSAPSFLPKLLALADTAKASGAEEDKSAIFKSENYQARQINLGGETVFISDENLSTPLTISEVKSESVTDFSGEINKFFISWRTNRLTSSEISYFRAGENETAARKIRSSDFANSHSVALNGLDKATVYNFIIKVRDRWGNEAVSNRFAAYSGSKPMSVFQLITNTLQDSFKWALKKE